jgi:hypothetical protein
MSNVVKLIHADNFFPGDDANRLLMISRNLNFVEKQYGLEIDNFNLVFPGLDPVFSKVVGEEITVDEPRSGIFRRPMNCIIHFEEFDSLDEWCFIIALEPTTFNLYNHLEDGPMSKVNARSALDGYKFNYRNLFEWDVCVNIRLEQNQGVIFRPWLFHSIEDGIVQYYRLIGKKPEEIKDET